MANTSSALHDVITAIVGGLRAAAGFRSPWGQVDGTTVYDSTEALLTNEAEDSFLIVGWTGDRALGEAADAPQDVATMGTLRHRDEDPGTVRCLLVVQTGDHEVDQGQVPALRGQAFALLDAIDAWLRANGALGLVPPYRDLYARLGSVQALRPYAAQGLVVEVEFTIIYRARI